MSSRRRQLRVCTILGVAALLLALALNSGCGFQLRGSVELPPLYARTQVEGIPVQSNLYRAAVSALQAAGATVVRDGQPATARLELEPADLRRRPLSVSTAGQVLEHELRLSLRYRVEQPGGEFTFGPEQVEAVRVLTFDPTQVSAKAGEEESLRASMEREAVNLMLLRLRSVSP
jgi:LPS-assembly lipoprotein